jgi:hypothetical protein
MSHKRTLPSTLDVMHVCLSEGCHLRAHATRQITSQKRFESCGPARHDGCHVTFGVGEVHYVLVALDELELGRAVAADQLRLRVPVGAIKH